MVTVTASGVNELCPPMSRTHYPLLGTDSTQDDQKSSRLDCTIVEWDEMKQTEQKVQIHVMLSFILLYRSATYRIYANIE